MALCRVVFNHALVLFALASSSIPGSTELALALKRAYKTTVKVRGVSCKAFQEEPTEFRCSFEEKVTDTSEWGRNAVSWRKRTAIITDDGGWLLLDESDPSEPNLVAPLKPLR